MMYVYVQQTQWIFMDTPVSATITDPSRIEKVKTSWTIDPRQPFNINLDWK